MREWSKAIVCAAAAAGASLWMVPGDASLAEFVTRTAMLVTPFRLAVLVEQRSGVCWISRLWT